MAGERLAKLTVRLIVTHQDAVRGQTLDHFTFTLGGQAFTYRRGGQAGEFVVPDPDEVGEGYGLQAVRNLLQLLASDLFVQQLPYRVTDPTQVGTTATYYDPDTGKPAPIIEFSVQATDYGEDRTIDFSPSTWTDSLFSNAIQVTERLTNITPIFATVTETDATYYGAQDGRIVIQTSGGDGGLLLLTWSDGLTSYDSGTITRSGVKAGHYSCVISNGAGASVTVQVDVQSDAQLLVQVQQVASDVTLLASGGLAPYAYAWADGPTTSARQKLAPGTYACTVTDARGIQVTVSVTVGSLNLFYFSRNPVALAVQAATPAAKPNLRFLCHVFVEPQYLSGTFVGVGGTLSQPADETGATVFDVSALLDDYVRPDFPAHGEAGAVRADGCFKRFYLQYGEQWDGSPAPTFTVRETHYLVYGGLDFFEYATQRYFTVYRPAVHPFLSWQPASKEVFADQPEYLYYQHDSLQDDTFTVQVRYATAGGASASVVLTEQEQVQCFEVWRVGVGLPQLRAVLGAQLPADVVAWQVQAFDLAGQAVTETRSYQLSDELPAGRRYFLFANSVGGIDTLATVGKAKTEYDFASVLVQRSLLPGYQADQGETYTASVSAVPVQRTNTGYLAPAWVDALQDFLLSEEIRRWDADRYRPGSLQPLTTLPLDDDDEAYLSVEFAFVLPTRRRYTPTLPLHY